MENLFLQLLYWKMYKKVKNLKYVFWKLVSNLIH